MAGVEEIKEELMRRAILPLMVEEQNVFGYRLPLTKCEQVLLVVKKYILANSFL